MRQLTTYLSILESSDNPLSADVYFIKGKDFTYIVDVGSCEKARDIIKEIPKKKVIITHFHSDHCGNLTGMELEDKMLYVGDYTRKAIGRGSVIVEPLDIEDGIRLRIVPVPNSHAKGSLAALVNEEYLILGDAYYANVKGYNVSLLKEEITFLQGLSFQYALLSHDNIPVAKEELLDNLLSIYRKRDKSSPYIPI